MNMEWEKPSVGIEIVGGNLVLILSHANGWRPNNRTFIYEWKPAVLKVVRVPLTFFLVLVSTERNRAWKHPTKVIQAFLITSILGVLRGREEHSTSARIGFYLISDY